MPSHHVKLRVMILNQTKTCFGVKVWVLRCMRQWFEGFGLFNSAVSEFMHNALLDGKQFTIQRFTFYGLGSNIIRI